MYLAFLAWFGLQVQEFKSRRYSHYLSHLSVLPFPPSSGSYSLPYLPPPTISFIPLLFRHCTNLSLPVSRLTNLSTLPFQSICHPVILVLINRVSSSQLSVCLPAGRAVATQFNYYLLWRVVLRNVSRQTKAAGKRESWFRARPGCCSHSSLSESFCLIKWGAEIGFAHLNAQGTVIVTSGHTVMHKTHARGGNMSEETTSM